MNSVINNPTATNKSASIIYNPLAGRGKAASFAKKAKIQLLNAGWNNVEVIASEYAGHIEEVLAKQCSDHSHLIVLVGGDGTLRELVAGLRKAACKPEIAFIPMGNANVVARELNIPLDPSDALQLLNTQTVKEVDIGILTQDSKREHIFLAMLEIGFGAKIVSIVNRLRHGSLKTLYRIWGDLVYAIAGLLALQGLKHKTFSVQLAGEEKKLHSTHGVIASMKTYAKGWSLTPDAKFDDGLLDTAISKNDSIWATLYTFISASKQRRLKPSLMTYQRTEQVKLETEHTLFAQIDGDPIEFKGNASVTVEKAAFKIRTLE